MRPPPALHPLHLWLVVATITASTSAAPSNPWASSPDAASSIFSPWETFRSWVVTAITGDPSTPVHSFSGLEDPDRFRKAQFGNDMVLRFNISTIDEGDSFAEACDTLFLDVWASTKSWVDVRLSKDVSLQTAHIPLMRSADLLKAIGDSYPKSNPSLNDHGAFTPSLHRAGASTRGVFFDDYRPWNVITHWMRLMSSLFPSHVRLTTIGKSFEGRDIPAFHLGVHPTNSARPLGPRKTILITAGLHAREWISISTVNYIAYSLIRDYGKSPAVTKMLEHFDWVFVPSLNPDGYLYTWNSDRLWRKNRQPTPLPFCNGIDLDRSFDFRWNGSPGSGNPCSENYAGEAAFEGHEARVLAAWAKNLTQNDAELITLLDLHSYSQEILYPYAFSCADDPPTLEDLEEMGEGLAKAIRRRGSYYSVISACEGNVLQPASALRPGKVRQSGESAGGSLLDWFYHELQAKIAYQFKLRDQGSWGFLLPPSYIVPVGDEILDAVMFLGETLLGHDAAAADKKEEPASSDPPRDGTQRPLGDHGEFKT